MDEEGEDHADTNYDDDGCGNNDILYRIYNFCDISYLTYYDPGFSHVELTTSLMTSPSPVSGFLLVFSSSKKYIFIRNIDIFIRSIKTICVFLYIFSGDLLSCSTTDSLFLVASYLNCI